MSDYRIKSGDTLSRMARYNQMSTGAPQQASSVKADNTLKTDSKPNVPGSKDEFEHKGAEGAEGKKAHKHHKHHKHHHAKGAEGGSKADGAGGSKGGSKAGGAGGGSGGGAGGADDADGSGDSGGGSGGAGGAKGGKSGKAGKSHHKKAHHAKGHKAHHAKDHKGAGGAGGSKAGGSADGAGGSKAGGSAGGSSAGGAGAAGGAAGAGEAPKGQVGDWIKQAQQALQAAGVPADKMNAQDIAAIIQHESSGNPNAQNNWDSNAKAGHPSIGLMQTIQPTFDAYKLPGHDNIRNPVDNIIAGVRYSIARYGSVSNVPGIKSMNSGGSYVGY